ncbi:hypothetical protein ABZ806_15430 [Spirillospora sp. NPDC047418]
MTVKQILAMFAGSLVGKWVRDQMVQLGLDRVVAAVLAAAAASAVTAAVGRA